MSGGRRELNRKRKRKEGRKMKGGKERKAEGRGKEKGVGWIEREDRTRREAVRRGEKERD